MAASVDSLIVSWVSLTAFCCRAEAGALLGKTVTAAEAAAELGSLCSLAAVTDGANGSCLSALGRLQASVTEPVVCTLPENPEKPQDMHSSCFT
jgi:hypothetical protein